MKYYLIAGEASGDLHGANLIKELKKKDPNAIFRGLGGDLMQEQGMDLQKHYRQMAFMGIFDVVMNLPTILNNMKNCKKDIQQFAPDVVILIDYPGFNLKIAQYTHTAGIKTYYYISPKIWAWKQSRIKQIKKYIDRMYVIFPFETEFYKKFDYPVTYIGNPLLDSIEQKGPAPDFQSFLTEHQLVAKPIIALLPGSRKHEIARMLPVMLELIPHYPGYQFIIAGAPSMTAQSYAQYIEGKNVTVLFGKTYEILQQASAAVVTSGTATLETALLNIPQMVCYKTGNMTYSIGKFFVKIKFFSLVNIIADQEVVQEYLQHQVCFEILKAELDRLLFDANYRQTMLNHYQQIRHSLGGSGASRRMAEDVWNQLTKNQ